MVAGLAEERCQALRSYGENLGMAFQIMDDILDFTADATELGKPAGSDLMNGTLTLPSLLLIERDPEGNPVKRYFAGRQGQGGELAARAEADPGVGHPGRVVPGGARLPGQGAGGAGDGGDRSDEPAIESLTDVAYWVTQRRS